MKRIAITGGIGSGKTAATSYLSSLGYSVVDADEALTTVTQPGSETLDVLIDAFGSRVVQSDGTYNRAFVSKLIFSDSSARNRLNAITHKAIGLQMAKELNEITGSVVFVGIPLFRAAHRESLALDEAWAIIAPPEVAIERLVSRRGMTFDDAQARIGAQITNEERRELCDVAVENVGTLSELYEKIDELLSVRGLRG